MKKTNFLRDENGGILIMGVFALLLIGMGLLALSIDVPMTYNKEADAQMWLRKATAQAAKEMQYTMYRCAARGVTGKQVSDRPNNLWRNCPIGASGGIHFITTPGLSWNDARDYMRLFIANNFTKTKTQSGNYCVDGVQVRKNANGEYYLYAYMDYPESGLFTLGKTGNANCTCQNQGIGIGNMNNPPVDGCKRVESGKLLTRTDDLPYQIKAMLAALISNETAKDVEALNSFGNVLDNIGLMMQELEMVE